MIPGRKANQGIKVLVAHESDAARAIVRSHLACMGVADVAEASNGREALAIADAFEPDLILVAQRMPVVDGFAFVDTYRAGDTCTPIVMISDDRSGRVREPCDGIAGHLAAPFTRQQLAECLRCLLGAAGRKVA